MNDLTVIIATYNRPARLVRTLEALAGAIRTFGRDCFVIVVDNGDVSSAETVTRDSELSVSYLQSEPGNKSAALNKGIAAASTEWLAFTDDDALPDSGWLSAAADFVGAADTRMFGGKVLARTDGIRLPSWLKRGRSGRLPVGPAIVEYAPLESSGDLGDTTLPLGSNMFAVRALFDKHGGYDESLWQACGKAALGCEDTEFGFRMRAAGEKIGYCAEAVVQHPVYRERATLGNHLRWSYRAGIRDVILCPHKGRRRFTTGFALTFTAASLLRSSRFALSGDKAAAVCELMNVAHVMGQTRGGQGAET